MVHLNSVKTFDDEKFTEYIENVEVRKRVKDNKYTCEDHLDRI